MGRWGHNWQSLAVDTVDWLLVLWSESALVLHDVSEEDGLETVDVLVEGDAGAGASLCLLVVSFVGLRSLPEGV